MNNKLHFDFRVDKENARIYVDRAFAAPLSKVWAAWTQAELLDQWWAPKPFKAVTKEMDFREGGHWLYAMTGPDNFEHWCRADYKSIDPEKSYTASDAFCDPNGVPYDFPTSTWHNSFSETDGTTTVNIVIQHSKLEDLEKFVEMGFKEGFTAGLENLDALLAS